MSGVVFPRHEMDVIGGHQTESQILREPGKHGVHLALLLNAMIVHLEEKIILPEDVAIPPGHSACLGIIVVLMDRHGDFALQTRAHPDESG